MRCSRYDQGVDVSERDIEQAELDSTSTVLKGPDEEGWIRDQAKSLPKPSCPSWSDMAMDHHGPLVFPDELADPWKDALVSQFAGESLKLTSVMNIGGNLSGPKEPCCRECKE
jgi:hypothetical protein